VVAALLCLALPVAASAAEPCTTPYDGVMAFPEIHSPEDAEDYCWEVKLGEGDELRAIDDTHAGVFWEDGTKAMSITAQLAHDADGTTVPTTLAVTEPNLITLTVHHRAGNPAAGGVSFVYPITAGAGWEGGFQTYEGQMPPPTEQSPAALQEPPAPQCAVPVLQGRTLKAARRALHIAHCRLGPVHGRGTRGAKVVKQYRPYGAVLPAGTPVGVRLGR
jgi:hypothetical protein